MSADENSLRLFNIEDIHTIHWKQRIAGKGWRIGGCTTKKYMAQLQNMKPGENTKASSEKYYYYLCLLVSVKKIGKERKWSQEKLNRNKTMNRRENT